MNISRCFFWEYRFLEIQKLIYIVLSKQKTDENKGESTLAGLAEAVSQTLMYDNRDKPTFTSWR